MKGKNNLHERLFRYGTRIQKVFPHAVETCPDPIRLCSRLMSLEVRARNAATDRCNGDIGLAEEDDIISDVVKRLAALLGADRVRELVVINTDPRGYALKVNTDAMAAESIDLPTDMAGYGILAYNMSQN